MRSLGVARLKATLSEQLRRVKRGEEILVLERGRPIGRLVPPANAQPDSDGLQDLVEAGLVRRAARALPDGFFALPRARDRSGAVRQAVLAEREEGR